MLEELLEIQWCSGISVKLSDHPINLSIKKKNLVHAENSTSTTVVEIQRQCNINCRLVSSVHVSHVVMLSTLGIVQGNMGRKKRKKLTKSRSDLLSEKRERLFTCMLCSV